MAENNEIVDLLKLLLPKQDDGTVDQVEAGSEIGVNPKTIGNWVKGKNIGYESVPKLEAWLDRRKKEIEAGDADSPRLLDAIDQLRKLLEEITKKIKAGQRVQGSKLSGSERRPAGGVKGELYTLVKMRPEVYYEYVSSFEELVRREHLGLGERLHQNLPLHIKRHCDGTLRGALARARQGVGLDRLVVVTTDNPPRVADKAFSGASGLTHAALYAISTVLMGAELLAVDHQNRPDYLEEFVERYVKAAEHSSWRDRERVVFIDDVDEALRGVDLGRFAARLAGTPLDTSMKKPVIVVTCAAATLLDHVDDGILDATRWVLNDRAVRIPVAFDPVDEFELDIVEARPLLPYLVQSLSFPQRLVRLIENAKRNDIRWAVLEALALGTDAGGLESDEVIELAEKRYRELTKGLPIADKELLRELVALQGPAGLDGEHQTVTVPHRGSVRKPRYLYSLTRDARKLVDVDPLAGGLLPERAFRSYVSHLMAVGKYNQAAQLLFIDEMPEVEQWTEPDGDFAEQGLALLQSKDVLSVTKIDVLSVLVAHAVRAVHGHTEAIDVLTAATEGTNPRTWAALAALHQLPQQYEVADAYGESDSLWRVDLDAAAAALQSGIDGGATELYRLLGDLEVREDPTICSDGPVPDAARNAYVRAAAEGDRLAALRAACSHVLHRQASFATELFALADPEGRHDTGERAQLPVPDNQPPDRAVTAAIGGLTDLKSDFPDDDVPMWLPHAMLALVHHAAGDRQKAVAAVKDAVNAGLPARHKSPSTAVRNAGTLPPDDLGEPAARLLTLIDVKEHPDVVDRLVPMLPAPVGSWMKYRAALARGDEPTSHRRLYEAAAVGHHKAAFDHLYRCEQELHEAEGRLMSAKHRDPKNPLVAKVDEAAELVFDAYSRQEPQELQEPQRLQELFSTVAGLLQKQDLAPAQRTAAQVLTAKAVDKVGVGWFLRSSLADWFGPSTPTCDALILLKAHDPPLAIAAEMRLKTYAPPMHDPDTDPMSPDVDLLLEEAYAEFPEEDTAVIEAAQQDESLEVALYRLSELAAEEVERRRKS